MYYRFVDDAVLSTLLVSRGFFFSQVHLIKISIIRFWFLNKQVFSWNHRISLKNATNLSFLIHCSNPTTNKNIKLNSLQFNTSLLMFQLERWLLYHPVIRYTRANQKRYTINDFFNKLSYFKKVKNFKFGFFDWL